MHVLRQYIQVAPKDCTSIVTRFCSAALQVGQSRMVYNSPGAVDTLGLSLGTLPELLACSNNLHSEAHTVQGSAADMVMTAVISVSAGPRTAMNAAR